MYLSFVKTSCSAQAAVKPAPEQEITLMRTKLATGYTLGELMIRSADTLARVIELLYDLQERGNVYLQIYHRKR